MSDEEKIEGYIKELKGKRKKRMHLCTKYKEEHFEKREEYHHPIDNIGVVLHNSKKWGKLFLFLAYGVGLFDIIAGILPLIFVDLSQQWIGLIMALILVVILVSRYLYDKYKTKYNEYFIHLGNMKKERDDNKLAYFAYEGLYSYIDREELTFEDADLKKKREMYVEYKEKFYTIRELYRELLFKDPEDRPPLTLESFPKYDLDEKTFDTDGALDIINNLLGKKEEKKEEIKEDEQAKLSDIE